MGEHHWSDDSDDEHDLALIAAVCGLGDVREPDAGAIAAADELDADGQPDLRGDA
jgi:hypothetical protein